MLRTYVPFLEDTPYGRYNTFFFAGAGRPLFKKQKTKRKNNLDFEFFLSVR